MNDDSDYIFHVRNRAKPRLDKTYSTYSSEDTVVLLFMLRVHGHKSRGHEEYQVINNIDTNPEEKACVCQRLTSLYCQCWFKF